MKNNGFSILLVRKQKEIFGGPSDGGRYSLESACPHCGTGAIRVEPLTLVGESLPSSPIFTTLDFEYLVNQDLAERIRKSGLTCLRQVLDRATLKPLLYEQLLPEAVLPPFSPESTGYERYSPCAHCGRDGYFGTPKRGFDVIYRDVDPSYLLKDCLETYERFGNSRLRPVFRESFFAKPLLIVSPRLADLLRLVEGVEFEPARFL
jgi:hypothetical protein